METKLRKVRGRGRKMNGGRATLRQSEKKNLRLLEVFKPIKQQPTLNEREVIGWPGWRLDLAAGLNIAAANLDRTESPSG